MSWHAQRTEGSTPSGSVSAREFDRLTFLLRLSTERRADDDGSPMDVSPSPFQGLALLHPMCHPHASSHALAPKILVGICMSACSLPHVMGLMPCITSMQVHRVAPALLMQSCECHVVNCYCCRG
jgi:hypothetical protein